MGPQRRSAETVYFAALAEPAEARAQFLDRACGGDAELRRQVERLLRAQPKLGDFLEPPELPEAATRPDALRPREDVAGPYKLLQRLGEGGMGEVWMAQQQEPVRRLVALKLIKPGMDSAQVLARFEAERQALALMDHPNIAKVLDAGATEQGRPYFVMELVKGVPITQFCDERRLGLRERLGLLVGVCQAVQHAHQKGVIHRDLKPSNVLVALYDERAVPKVIDFGVAKAAGQPLTERTLVTGFGALVGTLEYMSPEQAELNNLDIDTRSDVYSLGVLLYELLTGSTPLERGRLKETPLLETLRLIREEEPTRPSAQLSTAEGLPALAAKRGIEPGRLTRLLRGELDWIALKALEKDRSRRYESASALAADMQRYLADEPVEARPASKWYRARKFVRRNRVPVLAASLVALGLAGGVAGLAVGLFRAREAEAEAVQSATAERQAKDDAERRLRQLDTANAVLGDVFRDLDPRSEEKGGQPLRALLGERLVRAAATLDAEEIGDPLVVAQLRHRLAVALSGLGLHAEAIPILLGALDTRQSRLGRQHPATLRSLNSLAVAYDGAGKPDQAQPLYEEVAAGLKAALGPDHADTLRVTANLAFIYGQVGRREQAAQLYRQTLNRQKAVLGPDHPDTLRSAHGLAVVLLRTAGKNLEALALLEDTLPRQKAQLAAHHPDTLHTMGTLAAAYSAAWKEDKAIALLEEVIRLSEAHLGPDHPETLRSRGSLAALFWRTNQLNRSVPLFEVVLKDQVRKLGADHPKTLATKANLGVNYRDLGRPGDALPLLEEAARHAREHDSLRWVGFPLAELYAGLGRPAEAAAQVKTNLEIARSTLPAGSPTLATELNHNATVLLKLGAWGEAEACLREALAIREKHGPDDWRTFQARSIVGEALAGQKRFTDAEPLLLAGARGLQRRAAKIPAAARNKLLGDALSRLVQMYDAWGKPAEVAQWQAKLDELKKPSPKTPNR